jgi:putative tryptophan/tyrosine transport system substrate-binding protein
MKRREFITALGGAAAWPVLARAQQSALPVVGFINAGFSEPWIDAALRKGLSETGYVESQNVTVEYHWLEGQYDYMPTLVADLVRRRVAVITTSATPLAALAAKAATATIPIIFSAAGDPVQLGLVASLARPGGNTTGINYFSSEVVTKRLRLLHDLVPKAVRIAVLINPENTSTANPTLRELHDAAPAIGLRLQILNATTTTEIDAAFASLSNDRPDALFVGGDTFFYSRRAQIATLALREKVPTVFGNSDAVTAGGLIGYSTDLTEVVRLLGSYTGRVLKGEKPADIPVLQMTKFILAINLQTARALGIEVPSGLLSIADEVVE